MWKPRTRSGDSITAVWKPRTRSENARTSVGWWGALPSRVTSARNRSSAIARLPYGVTSVLLDQSTQLATARFGTRRKSRRFRVTTMARCAKAILEIRRSARPTFRRFLTTLNRSNSVAAAVSNGRILSAERSCSVLISQSWALNSWAPSAAFNRNSKRPRRSSTLVMTVVATSESATRCDRSATFG